jgi:hypothetical protein
VSTQSLLSASSVTGVQLQDSLFQASGALGVSLDGNFSTISGCEFAHSASTALSVSGGNWCKRNPTLFVSAEVVVRNNTFYDWARWQRTPNSPALSWSECPLFLSCMSCIIRYHGSVSSIILWRKLRNLCVRARVCATVIRWSWPSGVRKRVP